MALILNYVFVVLTEVPRHDHLVVLQVGLQVGEGLGLGLCDMMVVKEVDGGLGEGLDKVFGGLSDLFLKGGINTELIVESCMLKFNL